MSKTKIPFKECPGILILEDDPVLAILHRHMVEKFTGIEPLIFSNGRGGMDYLDQRTEDVSDVLVLLDINMPIMTGWEFLETCRLKKYNFQVHVIMVTSSLYKEDYEKSTKFEQVNRLLYKTP